MKTMVDITSSFATKMDDIFSTVWGWILTAGIVVCNFFSGYGLIASAVIIVIILDAIWGVAVAIKRNKYACSELMRDTFAKITSYGTAIVIAIFIEKLIGTDSPICSSIVSAVICITELWSISGNILIIYPDIAFFQFLRPALRGEIARKLQIDTKDVDKVLKQSKKKVTTKVKKA